MLNQVIIVGQVIKMIEEDKETTLILSVDSPRDDITREIPVIVGENFKSSMEYITVGTTIGAKAHIETPDESTILIVAEKLTFINTKGSE